MTGLVSFSSGCLGAELFVGAAEQLKAPSDAARVAKAGDTVIIEPGTYFDCAVWTTSDISIRGTGQRTILTDRICEGKAIFVVRANNVRISDLTFQRARAEDGNGAGIRAEGENLTVQRSRFLDNQSGILGGAVTGSKIVVQDSTFIKNGTCIRGCAHAIYVGNIAALTVTGSSFFETLVGHHIKSRAAKTLLVGNRISDGRNGTASYEVDVPNGGSLIMRQNVLDKGPHNQNHKAAVMIGEEGETNPPGPLEFTDNIFVNNGPSPFYFLFKTAFVNNHTSTPAVLTHNFVTGKYVVPLAGAGIVK